LRYHYPLTQAKAGAADPEGGNRRQADGTRQPAWQPALGSMTNHSAQELIGHE
jgi:hypothetical protein